MPAPPDYPASFADRLLQLSQHADALAVIANAATVAAMAASAVGRAPLNYEAEDAHYAAANAYAQACSVYRTIYNPLSFQYSGLVDVHTRAAQFHNMNAVSFPVLRGVRRGKERKV